jgi:hypothetical protein
MAEMAAEERFRYVCGKCRSAGLYRDDDPFIGDSCIVCPICGNRYYNDVGRVSVGISPMKIPYIPRLVPKAAVTTNPRSERSANLFPGRVWLASCLPARTSPEASRINPSPAPEKKYRSINPCIEILIRYRMAAKINDPLYVSGWSDRFLDRIAMRSQARREASHV